MNRTYNLTKTVFRAENPELQRIQLDVLQKHISDLLINKKDDEIYDAIRLCHEESNELYNLLDENIANTINTIVYNDYKNIKEFKSDMFLISVINHSENEYIKFFSLKKIEESLNTLLHEHNLINERAKVYLAPVFIAENKSKELKHSDWYDLHMKTLENASARFHRDIYSKDFSLKNKNNKPILNFICGCIIQVNENNSYIQPRLLTDDYYSKDDKESFIKALNSLNQDGKKDNLTFSLPQYTFTSLYMGYNEIQQMMINNFIQKYSTYENVSYAIISLDILDTFVLLAWDESKNKILNYFLIEAYGVTTLYNVEYVMDCISQTSTPVYVGKNIIAQRNHQEYLDFDFKEYLEKHGADMLTAEEDPEFY